MVVHARVLSRPDSTMTYDFTAPAPFTPILLNTPNTRDQILDILDLSARWAASVFWVMGYVNAFWVLATAADGLESTSESAANTGRGLNNPTISNDNFQFTLIRN